MGRGRHESTAHRMRVIYQIAEERQPISVRGIAYQLFIRGVLPSMASNNVKIVSKLMTQMREEGALPWEWIVDDTRQVEQAPSWDNPTTFIASALRQYRKNYWDHQPAHVQVWSEKATVSGVVKPVLDDYGVAFRVLHGFSSATGRRRRSLHPPLRCSRKC